VARGIARAKEAIVTSRIVVAEALLAARYADLAEDADPVTPSPLPLSGDDIYMFGLPWDPWLAHHCERTAERRQPGQPPRRAQTATGRLAVWLRGTFGTR
jgi:hypothetical protein